MFHMQVLAINNRRSGWGCYHSGAAKHDAEYIEQSAVIGGWIIAKSIRWEEENIFWLLAFFFLVPHSMFTDAADRLSGAIVSPVYVAPPRAFGRLQLPLKWKRASYKVLCSELKKSDIGDRDVYLFVKTFTSSQYLCLIQTTLNAAYKYSDGDCQMGGRTASSIIRSRASQPHFLDRWFCVPSTPCTLCLAFVIIVVGRAGHLYLDASQGPLPPAPG